MSPWHIIENIVTLAAVVVIVLFADGYWKFMALLALANINYKRSRDSE